MGEHVAGHDLVEVLASLTAARDATAAVRAARDRAWDVVQLHRLRADVRRTGRTDAVRRPRGSDVHQAVRDEVAALQP
ncbi:hypothetical protein [Streptomyces sp. NPDC002788]